MRHLIRPSAGHRPTSRVVTAIVSGALLAGCASGPPDLRPLAAEDDTALEEVDEDPADEEPIDDPEPEPEPEPELPLGREVAPGVFLALPDDLVWVDEDDLYPWYPDETPLWAARVPAAMATGVRVSHSPVTLDEVLAEVEADDRTNREIEPDMPATEVEPVTVDGADRAVRIADVSISGDNAVLRQVMEVGDQVVTVVVSQYVEDMFDVDLDFRALLDTVVLVPDRLP